MRAVLLTGHGGPEKLDYREDVPVPSVEPDEVLVKVSACGVNNTDIWVREGAYGKAEDSEATASFGGSALKFPIIQGADIVGEIVAVGPGVDESRIGQRVMVDFGIYPDDRDDLPGDDYIGHGRPGGFAEYTSVPSSNAHAIETSLSDAELATFCCAYITGERMLNRARVQAGERVLVTGASGGVGSGVIQLCRARNAIPYAVVGAGKEKSVLDIGAEATITRGTTNLIDEVSRVSQGEPMDVVVDMVAGSVLPELLETLRPHGRYVTCGAAAGPIIKIDLRRVYLRHLDILGSSQGTRADFAAVLDYVVSGAIKPLLAATYSLAELPIAQEDFKKKRFTGKLVIVVN